MIMLLDQILDPNTQAIICDVLQDGSLFEDGKKRRVKPHVILNLIYRLRLVLH